MNMLIEILFEPIFGVVILGVVYMLLGEKFNSHNKFCKMLVVLFIFMFLWRFFVAQVSTRYWAAVLFPALLIVVYVCYLPKFGKKISRLLIIALLLACVGKDFHLNWNNTAIIDASMAIKEDAEKYSSSLVTELEDTGLLTRIGYYSNVPILCKKFNLYKGIPVYKDIDRDIYLCYESSKGVHDVLYIVLAGNEVKHMNSFNKFKSVGAEIIFSQYKDMRKKNKIYVYKVLVPPAEQIPASPEKLIPNGDFEKLFKYTHAGDKLSWWCPENWGYPNQWKNSREVKLEQKNPISGKNSIRFTAEREVLLYLSTIKNIGKDGLLSFNVKSAAGAEIRIIARFCDEKGKAISQKVLFETKIPDNQLHQLQVPWQKRNLDFAPYVIWFWWVKAPNGLVLDDVEFYSEGEVERQP